MMRVALVHDWLTGMRGGERCLEALLDLYPQAEIFTLLHVPGSVSRKIESRPIHTSALNRLPGIARIYRHCLPLFPAAIERLDVSGFDLVVSISHCAAKGVRPPAGVPHLSYCLTPMRYLWDLYDAYFGEERAAAPVRLGMRAIAPRLRAWDRDTAHRADAIFGCSRHVAARIERCYGRPAGFVYPPVALERFAPAARREDFYLVVSALVPYKRVDLVVEAFNRLGRRLVIIGDGPERRRIRRMLGPSVTWLGHRSDAEVTDWLSRCRAFIFPAEDDFGITAVEAQASGAPVIAYAAGGALETVIDAEREPARAPRDSTGVFFDAQTPEAVIDAVRRFERRSFETRALLDNAGRFGVGPFRRAFEAEVERALGARPPGREGSSPSGGQRAVDGRPAAGAPA